MGRLKAVFNTVNFLTGITSRHNRALRELQDWAVILKKFLSEYRLYGSPDVNFLLQNIGEAKFDLTAIAYKARNLTASVKNIKDEQVLPLFQEIIDMVENTRRTLINPALHKTKLHEVVDGLRVSYEKFQDKLSEIEYI